MKHLTEPIQKLLALSVKERIAYVKSEMYIGYSQANDVLDKLEDLLEHPVTHRMPNLLIVGDTNNGKTVLVNKFCKKHRSYLEDGDTGLVVPVVYIQAPPKPDEKRFYNSLLDAIASPYRINDRVENKQRQVIQVMRHIKTRMLIIDEIHHILAGNLIAQHYFLNVIKYLANELQIVIVGVGTRDAFNAIQSDSQMSNRFDTVILQKWSLNNDYVRLLKSFESILPLKKESELTSKQLAMEILSKSEGYIGEISSLLRKATVKAIETGEEKITLDILSKTNYVTPSARKYQLK
jgi:type II secretory pathway predicted ATPase ExeA